MFSSPPRRTPKSQRTRESLVEVALASFRTRGYDDTTIRLIASEAGVSIGNAYYYFPTKNHLVQELYLQVQGEHHARARDALVGTDDLVDRIRIAFRSGIDTLQPFHEFAPGFLSAAMSPRSPINPLSTESEPARDIALATFREASEGARRGFPPEFADRIPELLLLGYLLVSLFWVYDPSPGQERTYRLIDRGVSLLRVALPLMRLPVLRYPMREFFDLVAEVRA